MGFLDRLRRRSQRRDDTRPAAPPAAAQTPAATPAALRTSEPTTPSVPPDARPQRPHVALPEPTTASAPGALPGPGAARIGDVDLPAGRPVAPDPELASRGQDPVGPLLWLTDGPVTDAPLVWQRLVAAFPTTGLWPLLCGPLSEDEPRRPWEDGELAPTPGAAITDDVEALLRARWADAWAPEDDDADPFLSGFPGLTRPMPEPTDRPSLLELGLPEDARIGLVPCTRAADAPMLVGWQGAINTLDSPDLSSVLRSWEDRFGATLVGLDFDVAHLLVTRPPRTDDDALAFAAEVAALCSDTVHQGTGTIRALADELRGRHALSLWWD